MVSLDKGSGKAGWAVGPSSVSAGWFSMAVAVSGAVTVSNRFKAGNAGVEPSAPEEVICKGMATALDSATVLTVRSALAHTAAPFVAGASCG